MSDTLVRPARTAPTRSSRHITSAILLPVAGGTAVILLWWLATVVFSIRPFFLPSPPDIVKSFMTLPGYLMEQARVTLVESLSGFGLAVVFGLAIAMALNASPLVERAILPLLVAGNAIPKVAVAPLLMMWMGFDRTPKVVMALLTCVFPIIVSTASGLSSTPADFGELAKSLRASKWHTFVKVRLPYAMPQIFVGLKVAITLALIGAVVGEISGGGSAGLGYVVVASEQQADTPLAFASVALLSIISIVLFYLVVALERVLLPWVRETAG